MITNAQSDAAIDSLAFALSVGLSNREIRQRVREDLRDSPFEHHRIHFRSYFNSSRGELLRTKLKTSSESSSRNVALLLERLPELELVIPKSLDRVEWQGGEDLRVWGIARSIADQIREVGLPQRGYRPGGVPITFVPDAYSTQKLIVLRPVSVLFPPDAEQVRGASPIHTRTSVSTFAEERRAQRKLGKAARRSNFAGPRGALGLSPRFVLGSCSPEGGDPYCCPDTADYCEQPPSSGPWPVANGGTTLSPEKGQYYCYGVTPAIQPGEDIDADGIRDDCEFEIAAAFAPLLNLSVDDQGRGHSPYWSVTKNPDRPWNVLIMYALSYYEDPGDFMWGVYWHHGDSEFIILEVQNSTTSIWGVVGATLSAHWQDGGFDATASYYYDDLEFPGVSYPRIWSSINKHANYRSREVCGWGPGGIAFWDSCEGDYQGFRVSVQPDRNLGNYFNRPPGNRDATNIRRDCTTSLVPGRTGTECFWTDTLHFSGWNPEKEPSATPYAKILKFYGF